MQVLSEKALREPRSSNLELLRILLMLSLIAHHFTVNSGVTTLYDFSSYPPPYMIFLQIFGMGGKPAINVFTLITGYFMIKKDLTVKKLLKLTGTTFFYIYLFYAVFLLSGYWRFSLKDFIKTVLFLPYGVSSAYSSAMIVMMLFMPFINLLARNMSKRQYQILLSLLLIYFTGISTFLHLETFNFVFWMLTIYLLGGYIRLYPCKWDTLLNGAILTIFSIVLMCGSILVIDIVGPSFGFTNYYYFIVDCNKILAVTVSIGIFILFKNWHCPYNKYINLCAASTYGILLFHANTDAMRQLLWKDIFDVSGHYLSNGFIPYACGVVILVYILGLIFESLRIHLIEKPFFYLLRRFSWINQPLWK